MKVFLSLLLAAVTCMDLGHSLQCYTCKELTPVQECLKIENCTETETICKTTIYSLEDVYPHTGVSTVTKMCSSLCEPSDVDGIGMTHPVTCCFSDLCNVDDAASTLGISVVPVGILASSLCAFFWTRL
ncbi:ly6/PLAUR domain-containing protein 2-like [Ammospiza caudacuta]|uniref:ly6/PLAUR domain-containing protein 2-like n=1 Tax=Melospiza georgiana TaxID=44398 RepID=UPI0025ACEDC3|nr:ly6/PLAUR domain-containing protein 2-like [Melospiza georgiana]XP_058674216.1 ly6/PLAUR domain-containing protein 2-like [Ammospiza caudacuta]